MEVGFEIWDVFTRERLLGNPLAVFPDAARLTDAQMGAIAREMAHSETTFIVPRPDAVERERGVRVRIFSKAGDEMPFAGHPTLGTAFSIWKKRPTQTVVLEENIGPITVEFASHAGNWEGEMLQPAPVFAEQYDARVMAPLLGVGTEDLDTSLPIENVSTGRPNAIVVIRSREAAARVSPDWRRLPKDLGVYLLVRDGGQWFARKPTPLGDDPVTGSAGGCAAAYLVRHRQVESGARIVLHQGAEVKRQGQMVVSARAGGSTIRDVKVGGSAVLSARGTLTL
jgi:trans-2,3-dihydro-3-hydroxyanthranilate isomerase